MYVPVNLRDRDTRQEKLLQDVDAALRTADFYMGRIPGGAKGVMESRVLEIGPGYSLGAAMVMACYGARVSVAELYPPAWDDNYHQVFISLLMERLKERENCDAGHLMKLLDAGFFDPSVIIFLECGIEDLENRVEQEFDYVFSCAVLEHVKDIPRACRVLGNITRPGGMHVHQVDFRDHRDFDHPLEFLAMSETEFQAEFDSRCGECGNRWRHQALGREFEVVGFQVKDFRANQFANDEYLAEVVPRLDAKFSEIEPEELKVISGNYLLEKTLKASGYAG